MDEWPIIPTSPAGGCWSTVLDLAKLLQAHLGDGGGILAPETIREMHELHARQGDADDGMGLGFRVTRSNGRKLACHGGDGGGFTTFAGIYPDEGVGIALVFNTGGMQVARSVIANTALGLLAGGSPRTQISISNPRTGRYRSNFWDIVVDAGAADPPTLSVTEGLVVLDEESVSNLMAIEDGSVEGDGGMFHGFEITLADGDPPGISGGVYPFTFTRTGDIPEPAQLDDDADLTGQWAGTVHTPFAPLPVTLTLDGETSATLTPPLGPATLERFRIGSGRVEGEFPLSMPSIGEFHNFLRLEARGGRLVGKTYARSQFGENAMPTELERT